MQADGRHPPSRASLCSSCLAVAAATRRREPARKSFRFSTLTRLLQVRSLASGSAKAAGPAVLLDWFALDFREELSVFDGAILDRQHRFLVSVIAALEGEYARSSPSPPAFILVGHSMGGVLARAAADDPLLPRGAHTLTAATHTC